MRRWWLALVLVCAGCPYVPEGEVRVETGAVPVSPGTTVSFRLYCDWLLDGWEPTERCGRDWQVQGEPGGNAVFGTIDTCGRYTAPLTRPPSAPIITASDCDPGQECADGCGAGRSLPLDAYPR